MRDERTVLVDGREYLVVRSRPSWTTVTTHEAWEADKPLRLPGEFHAHSTLTFMGGVCYGQVGTLRLPPDVDALPARTEARSAAVRLAYAEENARAAAVLLATFPYLRGEQAKYGAIEWETA